VQMTRWPVAVGLASVLLAGVLAPTASGDGAVVLGGGAGIVVDGSYCTLTAIGHDKTGQLVGFTAAHCGGPGAGVVAEGSENHGPVGSVAAADGHLDYSVIRFDPAKVTPTGSFAGFAINGIGADPDWHQRVCAIGAATGDACGGIATLPGPGPGRYMNHMTFHPGDDGGPVTSDGLLIGLVLDGFVVPPSGNGLRQQVLLTRLVLFSAILADVNAKGGPGAGFTPIPA
jgi:hypothetical protein